jgi:hypothetical protein
LNIIWLQLGKRYLAVGKFIFLSTFGGSEKFYFRQNYPFLPTFGGSEIAADF